MSAQGKDDAKRPRLRSDEWYAGDDRNAYLHRAWMRRGVPADAFEGRPQIAIANTASDLTPCNAHLDEVSQAVQRGVRSRFYRGGRYSPAREQGVHHFHRLLCEFLSEGSSP